MLPAQTRTFGFAIQFFRVFRLDSFGFQHQCLRLLVSPTGLRLLRGLHGLHGTLRLYKVNETTLLLLVPDDFKAGFLEVKEGFSPLMTGFRYPPPPPPISSGDTEVFCFFN